MLHARPTEFFGCVPLKVNLTKIICSAWANREKPYRAIWWRPNIPILHRCSPAGRR